jgi:lipopolysaccharide export LptBFGC system permease protein LptF
VARRPQQAPQQAEVSFDQVVGAVAAGAALLAGLGALFGDQGQPRANDAADELRRQNDELRRQNDLLRQALGGLGNQGITKRR